MLAKFGWWVAFWAAEALYVLSGDARPSRMAYARYERAAMRLEDEMR